MALSKYRSSGKVLEHCVAEVRRRLDRHHLLWKIGVTQDPQYRFSNPAFGYLQEGYSGMLAVHHGDALESGMLEAALIMILKPLYPGCQNTAPGGEGITRKPDISFYTYCAYKQLPSIAQKEGGRAHETSAPDHM